VTSTYYTLTIGPSGKTLSSQGDVHDATRAVKAVIADEHVARQDTIIFDTENGETVGGHVAMWYHDRTATEMNLHAWLTAMAVDPNGTVTSLNGTVVMVTKSKALFDIATHANSHMVALS